MNLYELPIHPALTILPDLHDDELQDMANSIKEIGQLMPVITAEVDGVMTLLDGRQRLAACKIAGVDPVVKVVEVDDPVSHICSLNCFNQYKTHTQRAIAVVLFGDPDTAVYNRDFIEKVQDIHAFWPEYLVDMAQGYTNVLHVHGELMAKKAASDKLAARHALVRKWAPELPELIAEGVLTLAAAEKVAVKRAKQDKQKESARMASQ